MKTFKFDYTHKNILITGGNSGIGFEAANIFSTLGGNVIVTCKKKKV